MLVRGVGSLNHAAGQQLLVDADCLAQQLAAARGALVVLLNDAVRGNDRVLRAVHQVQQHRVGDVEGGGQRLRGGFYQLVEGLLGPANEAFRRLLALGGQRLVNALGVVTELRLSFSQQASVLNIVLGCLNHHGAGGIKTGAASASSDLVELAGTQTAAAGTIKLRQRRNQHSTDGHVNAHTQGVGTANHLEQTLLSQLLHEAAVLGQHARVVNTDTGTHQLIQRLTEARTETELRNQLRDAFLIFLRSNSHRQQRIRLLQRRLLREVHNVDRSLLGLHELLHRLLNRGGGVVEMQRNGTLRMRHQVTLTTGQRRHLLLEASRIAQGRAHQQELRLRKLQQGKLPRPATLRVGVEMELIHNDLAEVRILTLAQGNIGENFRGAADNRRLRINGGVAGNHAHVLGTKNIDQVKELLRHQRLNGGGVVGTLTGRQARKMRGNSHSGLTGTGRGCQHHVMSGGNAQNGLVLGGVQGHAAGRNPLGEGFIDFFGGEGIAMKIASIVVAGVLAQRGRKKIQNTHENSSLSGIGRARGRYRYEGTTRHGREVACSNAGKPKVQVG